MHDVDESREAAIAYSRRGWCPVPIGLGSKHPPMEGWQDLRIRASDVPRYWTNGEGVGLLLGQPSGGLVDVDLDCGEAVRAADHILPSTNRVHGRASAPASHRWYICDPVPPKVLRFKDARGGTLLELRSTGGQTVVPPSTHPEGEPLLWERDDEPALVDGDVLRHAVSQLAGAALLARHWPIRGRHDLTLAVAGSLLRAGWGQDKVEVFVRAVCAAAGDEELEDRVQVVADTAKKLREGDHATGLPTLAENVGEDVVRRLSDWIGLSADYADQKPRPWRDPMLLTDPSPRELPVDVLPAVLRRHVVSVAGATQTPSDMGIPLALGAIAVCVQGKVAIDVKSGWEEPVNIYAATVAPPASRKSPVFRHLFAALERYEVEQARKAGPTRQVREDQREVMEKRFEIAKRSAAKGDLPLEAVEAARFELLAVKVPPLTRLNAPDATPEALVALMAEQGGRLAIWGPEGDPLDIAAGRYSGHGEARLDYRQAGSYPSHLHSALSPRDPAKCRVLRRPGRLRQDALDLPRRRPRKTPHRTKCTAAGR